MTSACRCSLSTSNAWRCSREGRAGPPAPPGPAAGAGGGVWVRARVHAPGAQGRAWLLGCGCCRVVPTRPRAGSGQGGSSALLIPIFSAAALASCLILLCVTCRALPAVLAVDASRVCASSIHVRALQPKRLCHARSACSMRGTAACSAPPILARGAARAPCALSGWGCSRRRRQQPPGLSALRCRRLLAGTGGAWLRLGRATTSSVTLPRLPRIIVAAAVACAQKGAKLFCAADKTHT
jgi:hypothetical protein